MKIKLAGAEHAEPSADDGSEVERLEARLRRVQIQLDLTTSLLRQREEEVGALQGRRSFLVAQALIDAKETPGQAWKLPFALAALYLRGPADRFMRRLPEGPRAVIQKAVEGGVGLVRRLIDPRAVLVNQPWPSDRPLVSVIVPCFNYGHFLDEALQSLYRQTMQDFEIIVVEGGSTDGATPQKVRSIDDPRVRKVFQPAPTRVGENRLRGLRGARGKYAVFLDADDKLEPSYLEKAVMALEMTGVDLVYPSVQLFDRENWVWETSEEFTLMRLAEANHIATVAMFRIETWERLEIGYGTDVDFEDWDFWLRFAEKGALGHRIAEPLMLYRVHGQSLTDTLNGRQAEVQRKVLERHPAIHDDKWVAAVSRAQRKRPVVKEPLINLPRLDRRAERSLRLAVATPWFTIGGSDHLLQQVFGDLKARDASLLIYSTLPTSLDKGSSVPEFARITDDVFELPRELPAAAQPDAIVQLLRSRETQVLMLVGSPQTYDLLPRLRQELPGLKVVDHLYNIYGHLASNRRWASHIDFHIVANDEVKNALLAAGEDERKIRVIHHGLDMERYDLRAVPFNKDGFPGLPLAAGEKLVLYSGRFSGEKGVTRFVEIAAGLAHRQDIVFAMTGDGPERPVVEKRIRELRLTGRVRLLGFVDDPRPYLRRADVVVIPSEIEGLPLVCLEALALGTPVVASAIGALPEVIRQGCTGFLADHRNVASFVDAVVQALAMDPRRERLAQACRASVAQRFAIENVREQYFDIFRRLAQ